MATGTKTEGPSKAMAAKKKAAKTATGKSSAGQGRGNLAAAPDLPVELTNVFDPEFFQPTQFVIPEDTSPETWKRALGALLLVSTGYQWWVGDAALFGENKWGDDSFEAYDPLLWDPKTVMNYRRVCERIPPKDRRERVSWSCHRLAAELGGPDGTKAAVRKALKLCDDNAWTYSEMDDYCKGIRAEQSGTDDDGEDGDQVNPEKGTKGVTLSVTAGKGEFDQIEKIMRRAEDFVRTELAKVGVSEPRITYSEK